MSSPLRLAMWSGPRNISTAMMYAFGNRQDFAAWDEPFYAAYLAATGIDHPMRDEVVAAHETDPLKVAKRCLGPIPRGRSHFYMKHMPFHMVDWFPLDWAEKCVNIHLIRHPARVAGVGVGAREHDPDVLGPHALDVLWRGTSGDDFPETDPDHKLRMTAFVRA